MGCSFSAVADPADGASDTNASQAALVTIERSSDATKADVVARVVRVTGAGTLDEAALRLAGFAEDLPAIGTCASSAARAGSTPAAALSGHLELVDLGQVGIELQDGARTPLVARHVPDPAGVLSGIMYNARITDATPKGESRVTVRASGISSDPDSVSFVASVSIPRDVADLRIASQDPRDFGAPPGPVDLTWTPAVERTDRFERGDLDDVVVIDVRGNDTSRPSIPLRCAFADTGRATIPLASDEGVIVTHRVRRERFRLDLPSSDPRHKATKHDEGEIRFDSARAFPFMRTNRRLP